MDMRHMVETHWTEQRSDDQLDYLDPPWSEDDDEDTITDEETAP